MILFADGSGGGAVDCSVDSPKLTGAADCFRSDGTNIIRFVGRNATMSSNSSGNFLYDAPHITIEEDSQLSQLSFSFQNPIININSNIQPPSGAMILGGEIRKPGHHPGRLHQRRQR